MQHAQQSPKQKARLGEGKLDANLKEQYRSETTRELEIKSKFNNGKSCQRYLGFVYVLHIYTHTHTHIYIKKDQQILSVCSVSKMLL